MAKKFNVKEIVITDPKKSSLDMGSSVKGTGKIGRLIPVFQQELLPNSTIHYTPNTLARFVPLAVPLMSNMSMRHHIMAVPFRQLVKDWETFITGGEFNVDNRSLPNFSLIQVYDAFNKILPMDFTQDTRADDAILKFEQIRSKFYEPIGYASVYDQLFGAYVEQFKVMMHAEYDRISATDPTAADYYWTEDLANLWNRMIGIFYNQWIGTGSLLDYLGYPVRDFTIATDAEGWTEETEMPNYLTRTRVLEYAVGNPHFRNIVNGLTAGITNGVWDSQTTYNDLPIRAYYRIWYYYFRDQNLDIVGDGYTPEDLKNIGTVDIFRDTKWFLRLFMLRPCAWTKDLFNTTTLQAYQNNAFVPTTVENNKKPVELSSVGVFENGSMQTMSVPTSWLSQMTGIIQNSTNSQVENLVLKNNDVYPLTGFTLQNMKKVEALSKWLDKNLYAGWCYADQLSSHFGVRYSDARLQLPEYVGGTKSMVQCQTLTNTTTTTEDTAGSQSAYAQGITANDGCNYFAEEHCIIIDILSIIPELSYKYSSPKHLLHLKKFDFAFPEFAQLGCDIVPRFNVANSVGLVKGGQDRNQNLIPFAYADRYYEYKNNINRLTGKLVDDNPLYTFTQDYSYANIEYANKFINSPSLNADFIHCVPSVDNFVSDSIEYEFMFDHEADVTATIPLPVVEYV